MGLFQGETIKYKCNKHLGFQNDADENTISYYFARNTKNGYATKTANGQGQVEMRGGTLQQNDSPFSNPIRYLYESKFSDGTTNIIARADNGWYKFNETSSEFEALRSPIGTDRTVDAKRCKACNYNNALYLTDGDRNIFMTSDGKAYFYGDHFIIDGQDVTYYSYSFTEITDGVPQSAQDIQLTLTYPTDLGGGVPAGEPAYKFVVEFSGGNLVGSFQETSYDEVAESGFIVGEVAFTAGVPTGVVARNQITPTNSYMCLNSNGLWLDDTNGTIYDNSGTFYSQITIDTGEGTSTSSTDVTEELIIDTKKELNKFSELKDITGYKDNYLVVHCGNSNLIYYSPAIKSQVAQKGFTKEGTVSQNSSVTFDNDTYSPSENIVQSIFLGEQYQSFQTGNLTEYNMDMFQDYIADCPDKEGICGCFDYKKQHYLLTIPQSTGAKTLVYGNDLKTLVGCYEFPWVPTSWLVKEDGTVLIGCDDGYMRKLSEEYYSDDGEAIDWSYLSNNLGNDYEDNFKRLISSVVFFKYDKEYPEGVKDNIEQTFYINYDSYSFEYKDAKPTSTKKLFNKIKYTPVGRGKWFQTKLEYSSSTNRIRLISYTITAEKQGFK